MTAATWHRVLEQVEVQARALTVRQVLLTVLAAPLFAAGWMAARVLAAVWVGFAWAWTAAYLGWREAGGVHARRGSGPG